MLEMGQGDAVAGFLKEPRITCCWRLLCGRVIQPDHSIVGYSGEQWGGGAMKQKCADCIRLCSDVFAAGSAQLLPEVGFCDGLIHELLRYVRDDELV